ncbi:hypothetical protein ACN28S_45140 [Cystobacter fuscus]
MATRRYSAMKKGLPLAWVTSVSRKASGASRRASIPRTMSRMLGASSRSSSSPIPPGAWTSRLNAPSASSSR